MGLIVIAIVFAICGVYFWKKGILDFKPQILAGASDAFILTVFVILALTAGTVGITGLCLGESEYTLESTKELSGINQSDAIYAFLDEEGNCYYVNGDKVQVINRYGVKESGGCDIITSNCENIYVEKYDIDYKMNFWTFNLVSGKEYKIYIPEK